MPRIGLEIHGYLNTKEKLFCNCKALHGTKLAKPNTNICPICTGQPGAKPMLPNNEAVNKSIQISSILNCKINSKLKWMRKHYDWADLPKGYQNTISGSHAIPVGENGKFLDIRIKEAHLEEDPASWNPKTGEIDYNKSGSPLIEIVTEPDFTSAEQVADWLKQLKITLGYIKAIDKEAGLKADVNVSLPEKKGERVEIKNINSIKNIKAAIEHEIERQSKKGETPKQQETRMFNEAKGTTIKMRTKELAQDYRFISEPDLPILNLKKERINKINSELPETPQEKLNKLIKKHNIDKKYAEILTKNIDIAEFFEQVISNKNKKEQTKIPPRLAVRWITEELLSVLNYNKKELDDEDINIQTTHFIELLELLNQDKITEQKAREILRSWIPNSSSPRQKIKGHEKITNKEELKKIIDKVLKNNKKAVEDYKAGQENALNFLIGQVMKETKGRADYKVVKEVLEKML